ncbi:MAG: hypothetical protein J6C37_04300 [Roseburia sp.]|nr:hypothetical protein [Roseburia sp.]
MQNKKNTDFRALLIIVDSNIREKLSEFMSEKQIPIYMQMHGMGTARSEFLSMSGLGDIHKSITLCFVPGSRTKILLAEMNQALKLHKRGTGIAISIPISGMQGWLYKLLDSHSPESDNEEMERDVKKMTDTTITHALILVTINQGYSDDVMNTARAAGATGGTVLKGLRCSPEKAAKVFSITIQEEQEIVAIVAPKEKKVEIMTAISGEHGLSSPAHGVALSLPVDAIMGL